MRQTKLIAACIMEVSIMKSPKAILACAVVASSVALAACSDSRTTQRDTTQPGTPPAGDAARASDTAMNASDVAAAPDKYFGQTVTVRGEVQKILTPMSFVLDDDGPDLGKDLLVFSPKAGTPTTIDENWRDQTVQVTGTVGKMTVVEIEREVGWDLDPQVEAEVESAGAVLIARSVERMPQ